MTSGILSTATTGDHKAEIASPIEPYISSAAKQFAPGAFVKTWNAEIGRHAIGIALSVEDPQEANPRIQVKWMHDLSIELIRAEYLYPETPAAFQLEVVRSFHWETARKWGAEAAKNEDAAREIRGQSDLDEIDQQECLLNESIAETLRSCVTDLLWPAKPCAPEEEIKF